MQDAGDTVCTDAGTFVPMAGRGLWWSEENALLVADLHLGKEDTFRHHGIPVPDGSSQETLSRLSAMIDATQCGRLFILGDLFHAATSLSQRVRSHVVDFLDRHRDVVVTLIRGNHDFHAGALPAAWRMEVVDPPVTIRRVRLVHFPQPCDDQADLTIAGHLHPAVRLKGGVGSADTLPCFWLRADRCLVLPAMGRFTGSAIVKPDSQDSLWAVTPEAVVAVAPAMVRQNRKWALSQPDA